MARNQILIVGAGPTGLTAAVELTRRGAKVVIIEKRNEASNLSRAVGILPRSLHLLEASGVSEQLRAKGIRFDHVVIHSGARQLANVTIPPGDSVLGLAQDQTEAILADTLHGMGVEIRYGAALKGLKDHGDHVTAQINDQPEEYSYVIGADGVRSAVRAAVEIPYPGIELPETWSIADVIAADWPGQAAFHIFLNPQGRIAVVAPLETSRFRVIANQPDALAELPVPMTVTKLRRSASFGISVRQAETYQRGRVFLAGDAAHCHSPAGGRGMNLGIADACELARRMVEGGLDGYSSNRHPDGAETLKFSETIRKLATSKNPFKRALITFVLRLLNRVAPLRRIMLRNLLQLGEWPSPTSRSG